MSKKLKITVVENGFDKEVEVEVPDGAGTWAAPEAMRVVGHRQPRLDGPAKVTGRALYVDDLDRPGTLYDVTVRSPVPRGRLRGIHFGDAAADGGVSPAYEIAVVRDAANPGRNHIRPTPRAHTNPP